jgi:hypothetical protein
MHHLPAKNPTATMVAKNQEGLFFFFFLKTFILTHFRLKTHNKQLKYQKINLAI